MSKDNIINLDQPQCSLCGEKRTDDQLNGYDPLAPIGQKYKNAYCIRVAECNSQEAQEQIAKLIAVLDEPKSFEIPSNLAGRAEEWIKDHPEKKSDSGTPPDQALSLRPRGPK